MSLENNLSRIADSLELIAKVLSAKQVIPSTPVQVAPVVVAAAPVAPAPIAPAPAMPAAPFPTVAVTPVAAPAPAPAPAPVAAPTAAVFESKQAMTDYVIASYRALGAEKGAAIQGVLTGMGFANINDVPAEQWGQLKTGIEALK